MPELGCRLRELDNFLCAVLSLKKFKSDSYHGGSVPHTADIRDLPMSDLLRSQ